MSKTSDDSLFAGGDRPKANILYSLIVDGLSLAGHIISEFRLLGTNTVVFLRNTTSISNNLFLSTEPYGTKKSKLHRTK